ncbi:hypothetical protein NHQ30_009025 [Ciborinia camelliae]|nr:hypothetical protein NHQ30_009025 [Ciborinia camelliae]
MVRFSVPQAVSDHGSFRSVAVPSRLYSSPTEEKPLAVVRVSIKDNYDSNGIRTTMMNRAFNELYSPRNTSADYAIYELDAIIVGKTKMSAFASAEEPINQWVDYHFWNSEFDTAGTLQRSLKDAKDLITATSAATPKYRDDKNKLPSIVGSFYVYLPAVLQLPQLIIPGKLLALVFELFIPLTLRSLVGQKPYNSRISGLKEYMPIGSSLMGAKGSDVMLINLAEAVLKNTKWPTEVQTGRETFEVEKNFINVTIHIDGISKVVKLNDVKLEKQTGAESTKYLAIVGWS